MRWLISRSCLQIAWRNLAPARKKRRKKSARDRKQSSQIVWADEGLSAQTSEELAHNRLACRGQVRRVSPFFGAALFLSPTPLDYFRSNEVHLLLCPNRRSKAV